MTKAEIRAADESTLQARWNELRTDPRTWLDPRTGKHKEFLMISVRLCLIRTEFAEAADYAVTLMDLYGESLF